MSKNIEWIDNIRKVRDYDGKWSGMVKKTLVSTTVELRNTFKGFGNFSQVLVVVSLEEPGVILSMNGKASMSMDDMRILSGAVVEARLRLANEALKWDG